ncbi:hypothetical protein AVEN_5476-1 [Araneus ventricosus]|uniref:Uncharacterized protein n=1 Tax=Araneus ventricosus TaxID=182803 RepID=A0A4Y2LXX9_ARAVE|nr:hypothetical protein AVEN_5476-1 [Araneus ventricosus]
MNLTTRLRRPQRHTVLTTLLILSSWLMIWHGLLRPTGILISECFVFLAQVIRGNNDSILLVDLAGVSFDRAEFIALISEIGFRFPCSGNTR